MVWTKVGFLRQSSECFFSFCALVLDADDAVVVGQVRTQIGVSSSNVLAVVDIFAVDALVLLTYEIAQGEFRAKNSTKPNEYLVQAVWQNCPARNTIHSAM